GDCAAQRVWCVDLSSYVASQGVDLDQKHLPHLERANIQRPACEPGRGSRPAAQCKRVAEGGQRLLAERRVCAGEQGTKRGELSLPIVRGAGGMLDEFGILGDQAGDRFEVPGGKRSVDASRICGGGV